MSVTYVFTNNEKELIMAKMFIVRVLPLLLLIIGLCYLYLDRALPKDIQPEKFTCLHPDQGYISNEVINSRMFMVSV
jgi:hypothetical protein